MFRWLASLRNGDLYVVSGDNELSAIWKYNRMMRRWMIVRQAKGTRYQYACVIEDHPEKFTTVLMTCDGVQGRLLMFFIVSGSAKIMKEYNMTQEWNLLPSVKNPASAIYDEHSNVLVLDYAAGKLWMVSASKGGAPPSVKVVANVGGQNAVGLTVSRDGWCFVACFGRRRVQAIKYLDL